MPPLLSAETLAAFLTLTALEIVLGGDNIIFLSISASRLPESQRDRARALGLAGAMLTRIVLLLFLWLVAGLTDTLVTIFNQDLSGRDFVLMIGGLFLIVKATLEIHSQIEGAHDPAATAAGPPRMAAVIAQIMLFDIVFSLDSVITAVGMTRRIDVMVAAIVVSAVVMMVFSRAIARFVDANPTIRILALAFLIMIGMSLVADAFDVKFSKSFLYAAMGMSVLVELINLRVRDRRAGAAARRRGGVKSIDAD